MGHPYTSRTGVSRAPLSSLSLFNLQEQLAEKKESSTADLPRKQPFSRQESGKKRISVSDILFPSL
jgi:hypothetical protein